jgi:hypothetical protein
MQSGGAGPNGIETGAVQSILLDPALGANTMFVGSTNGGIFITQDGGTTWKALTDNQGSLDRKPRARSNGHERQDHRRRHRPGLQRQLERATPA